MWDTNLITSARARNLAGDLDRTNGQQRIDLMQRIANDNHGSILTPHSGNRCCTHMVEIAVLGKRGAGQTLQEAIADWMQAARRATPVPNTAEMTDAEFAEMQACNPHATTPEERHEMARQHVTAAHHAT